MTTTQSLARGLGCLALLWLGTAAAVRAQDTLVTGRTPWIVTVSHWGRWPALATSAALVTVAAFRQHDARTQLEQLETYCRADPGACLQVPATGGVGVVYADPEAETLFQEYARSERRARGFLLGGQLSLLATGTMFLIDLIHDGDDSVPNIPYTPLELYTTRTRLGLSVRF